MKIRYAALCFLLLLSFCSRGTQSSADAEHVHDESQTEHSHAEDTPTLAEPADSSHQHEGESAGHTHTEEGETPGALTEDPEEHQDLTVSSERQKAWGIRVGHVQKERLTALLELPGVIALNQNKTAHVTAFVHGQISALAVDLGSHVKKGQSLLTLNSPEFAQVQADFLNARVKFNLSKNEFKRAQSLWEAKAIEEKEYLKRQAEHEKLATEYGVLGSRLHSLGLTHKNIEDLIAKCSLIEEQEFKCEVADPLLPILSPISGTVIFRDVVQGAHIEPEKILLTVSDLSTLWAHLDVYEKDIPLVTAKSRVSIKSVMYPGRSFPARISYISNLIDEKLRTMKVRVEVDNPDSLLKPNMYVQGMLMREMNDGEEVMAVPEEAVQNLDGEKIVFVRESEEVFTVRHIRIGDRVGSLLIILAGLGEHEEVVLKGAFTLKSELSKGTFGHAHVH